MAELNKSSHLLPKAKADLFYVCKELSLRHHTHTVISNKQHLKLQLTRLKSLMINPSLHLSSQITHV